MIDQYSKNICDMDSTYYTFCGHITDESIGYYKYQLVCSTQSFIKLNKPFIEPFIDRLLNLQK